MRIESGDIAVLGGLMVDTVDNKAGRFPGLGDIPFLGEVLNTRANSSAKTELVVLLRPTVIRDGSIEGDFSSFRESLPGKDFFRADQVFQPFSLPNGVRSRCSEPADGCPAAGGGGQAAGQPEQPARSRYLARRPDPGPAGNPSEATRPVAAAASPGTSILPTRDLASAATTAPPGRSAARPGAPPTDPGMREAAERTAARNVLPSSSRHGRALRSGFSLGLGGLATLAIGGYFWWQLQSLSNGALVVAPPPMLPTSPSPAPALAANVAATRVPTTPTTPQPLPTLLVRIAATPAPAQGSGPRVVTCAGTKGNSQHPATAGRPPCSGRATAGLDTTRRSTRPTKPGRQTGWTTPVAATNRFCAAMPGIPTRSSVWQRSPLARARPSGRRICTCGCSKPTLATSLPRRR
jgi:hypothetical protein